MKNMRRILAAALAAAVLLAASCAQAAGGGGKRILVIETTDMHGYILDASSGREETFQYRLAYIARRIDEARASGEYDGVVLLDGGDLYQGTPVSNLTGGAAVRAALDGMGYDAIALGNHEFDWDVEEYAADREGTIAPYMLGDRVGDGKTPILSSDLRYADTGEPVPFTRDHTVVERAGLRIAVVGYTPDYSGAIMAERIAPYRIGGDAERVNELARRVRRQERADAVIVLAHEDAVEAARAMDPAAVDLVAGGHTHRIAAGRAGNSIPYIQGYCRAQGFASAVLVFAEDGGVTAEDMRYTDITAQRELLWDTEENAARLDPEIMDISRAAWTAIREDMSEALGYTDTPIVSSRDIGASSAGNWITGLMLRAAEADGAVMAFYNTGGIRADLDIPAGRDTREITVYDMYTITPFANSLVLYDISGRELAEHLRRGLSQPKYGDQMSGLTFTYAAAGDADTPRAEREYTILSITLDDGTEVDTEGTEPVYRVCLPDYCATVPGSVFEGKEPLVPASDAPVDVEAFIRVLREERDAGGGYIPVDTGPRGTEAGD